MPDKVKLEVFTLSIEDLELPLSTVKLLKSVSSFYKDTDNREAIMRVYKNNPNLFLIAEDKGKIVGSVLGQGDGRIGFVWSLAVLPNEQGKGIGKKLMIEIESRLKKMGCVGICLFTGKEKKAAVNLYKTLGYVISKKPFVMNKAKL